MLMFNRSCLFQEVHVRFSGFGVEEDEWVNVRKCVRQRSLPCENAECVAVLPGDLILCFQVLYTCIIHTYLSSLSSSFSSMVWAYLSWNDCLFWRLPVIIRCIEFHWKEDKFPYLSTVSILFSKTNLLLLGTRSPYFHSTTWYLS